MSEKKKKKKIVRRKIKKTQKKKEAPKRELGTKCKNCILYDKKKGQCRVAVLVAGEQMHMPVFPEDDCHMIELGLPVKQIRWWVEDPNTGKPTDGEGVVKIEYPDDFFG